MIGCVRLAAAVPPKAGEEPAGGAAIGQHSNIFIRHGNIDDLP